MTLSLSTPAQIINAALLKAGVPGEVGSLFDGSELARDAIKVYGATRDAMLRESTWDFAKKTNGLTLSGQAAPWPWTYSYSYPSDCIQVRNVLVSQPDLNDPTPTLWTVAEDPVAGKVVLSNIANASAVYTCQITNPLQWDAGFLVSLVASLAEYFDGKYARDQRKAAVEESDNYLQASALIVG